MAGVELASAYLSLLPETSKIAPGVKKALGESEKEAGRSGKRAGKSMGDGAASGMLGAAARIAAPVAAAFAAINVGQILMDSIKKASDREQSAGAVEAIFKTDAKAVNTAAKSAAKDLGLTENAYRELASTLGAGLKNKGIKGFTGQTQSLIGLGADLAAQFGGSTEEAVSALSSLMRGESDPIERYGVSINETAIAAELAAKGQSKLKGAALEQAKAQARLNILFRQTKDAQGANAREAGTFAGATARMSAQWEDFQGKLGEKFLPFISKLVGWVNDTILPALDNVLPKIDEVFTSFENLGNLLFKGDFTGAIFGWEEDSPEVDVLFKVRDGIVAILDALKGEGKKELDRWAGAFEAIVGDGKAFTDWVNDTLVPGGQAIADSLKGLWDTVAPILTQLRDEFFALIEEHGPEIQSIFETIGRIVGQAMEIMRIKIDQVTQVLGPLWEAIGPTVLEILGHVFGQIIGILEGAFKIIEGIFDVAIGVMTGDWDKAWEGIKKVVDGAIKLVWSIIDAQFKIIDTLFTNLGWKKPLEDFGTWLGQTWKGAADWLSKPVKDGKDAIDTALGKIEDAFETTVTAVGTAWDKIKSKMSEPVKWVADNVVNPLIRAYNTVASAVSLSGLSEWNFAGFRDGGYTGSGGVGQIAGVVHGREWVMDAATTQKAGGPGAMERLRQAIWSGELEVPGYRLGGWVKPVNANDSGWNGGRYSSGKWHGGLDYPVPTGTPVVSPTTAKVLAKRHLATSYGIHAILQSSDGYKMILAHLSSLPPFPGVGSIIGRGQTVGFSGSTGNSTGPHLHFEVIPPGGSHGSAINPQSMLGGGVAMTRNIDGGGFFGGFPGPAEWLSSLMNGPLGKVGMAPGGMWGDVIGKLPGLLGGGMQSKIKEAFAFDSGGYLQPGYTLAYNGTGKPEPVFTDDQWNSMGSGGGTFHLYDSDDVLIGTMRGQIDRREREQNLAVRSAG